MVASTKQKIAPAGYSGTPLPKKIGLKEGGTLTLIGAPKGIDALFDPLPLQSRLMTKQGSKTPLAVLFCAEAASLTGQFAAVVAKMSEDGALWIAWPKKSSALFRDLTEDGIRKVVLPTGWVDVKVCAIDQDWSGLKLMKRRELRGSK